ncbi:hypothetical protein EJB05_14204, partial [Eragrostis curvula]
ASSRTFATTGPSLGSSPPPPLPDYPSRRSAFDYRHGRALLRSLGPSGPIFWDPISGGHKKVAIPAHSYGWRTAAVLCAAADGCDHRDCRGGPFTVVLVGTMHGGDVKWVWTYMSETVAWSAPTMIQLDFCIVEQRPGLHTEGAIYFNLDMGKSILKYDLAGRSLSVIESPDVYSQPEGIPIATDDGGLGFAGLKDSILFLWSRHDGPDVIAPGWVQHRNIVLSWGYTHVQPEEVISNHCIESEVHLLHILKSCMGLTLGANGVPSARRVSGVRRLKTSDEARRGASRTPEDPRDLLQGTKGGSIVRRVAAAPRLWTSDEARLGASCTPEDLRVGPEDKCVSGQGF